MPISFLPTNKTFSSLGGLYFFAEASKALKLKALLSEGLPEYDQNMRSSAYDKFFALMMGFIAGADCLDDMGEYCDDIVFDAVCSGRTNVATTYGDYLRRFEQIHLRKVQGALLKQAFKIREHYAPKCEDFILDIDSSAHQQYGKKMEGTAFNYNGVWCLDSLEAFDQFGIQYWMNLRPGATFTANESPLVISEIFRRVPRKKKRYLRADSGFCNVDVFNACFAQDVKFVIPMRENMYDPLIKRVKSWNKNRRIKFRDGREAELGTALYYPEAGEETLRVIIMRARKWQPDLFDKDPYDYRAFVTNLGSHEKKDDEIIFLYHGRGNAENYIRELKNGFDIHHFPCQKLMANRAYGLIAAFAYNFMRLASFLWNPKQFHFSKKIRFRMVYLAAQVVKKARYVYIYINERYHKEVLSKIHLLTSEQFDSG